MKRTFLVLLLSALVTSACVERTAQLSAAEREQLREHILTEAPTPQNALDISFENRVRLVGYDVSTSTVTPGQPFTITWYWHAQRRLDDGWQLFTHLIDGSGANRVNEDSAGAVRQLYQPGRWQEGEYIRDQQTITLPRDWNSDEVVFYLGVWKGDRRLSVTRGPKDGDDRARAATLQVTGVRASAGSAPSAEPLPPPPSLRAVHAENITIDGRLDEAAWQATRATSAFVNTVDGQPTELAATAKALWNDERLYVAFDVTNDTFLRNTLRGRDAHLWEQDAVELMIDPDGDGRNYFELQVSPTGEIFDTRYDSRRQPQPIGHADWNAAIEARVTPRGTVNDDRDDEGYVVELGIPWSSFLTADGQPMTAPPAGSTWRMNLYVMDTTRTGARSAGWSPTYERDFHVPARFGTLTFVAPVVAEAAAAAPVPERALALPPEQLQRLRQAAGAIGRGGMRMPPPDLRRPTKVN